MTRRRRQGCQVQQGQAALDEEVLCQVLVATHVLMEAPCLQRVPAEVQEELVDPEALQSWARLQPVPAEVLEEVLDPEVQPEVLHGPEEWASRQVLQQGLG